MKKDKARIELLVNSSVIRAFEIAPGAIVIIGRKGSGASIEIDDKKISRQHASIQYKQEGIFITDLGSTNGTWIKGRKVTANEAIELNSGDIVSFNPSDTASLRITFQQSSESSNETGRKTALVEKSLDEYLKDKNEIVIGRNADVVDVVLNDRRISRTHARVYKYNGRFYVEDLDSTNGTYINGERVFKPTELSPADKLYIGLYLFTLNGKPVDLNAEPAIEAIGLEKYYGEKNGEKIGLHTIDFSIPKQEFVALMGPSGCGKSTLLKALNGDNPATAGKVMIHGLELVENYEFLKRKIGYVPQDDIVHRELTVEKSLYYAAKLRLGDDVKDSFIEKKIDEVLSNLNINRPDLRTKMVGELSGGQRKRVSIAVELLNDPTILFLDEPTSPLDPETIEEFLKCIKDLTNLGTTVIMVTHKPEDLNHSDTVIFLTTKGYHAYYGKKGQAILDYFKASDIIGIYSLLSREGEIKQWYARWRNHNPGKFVENRSQAELNKSYHESPFRQFYWLSKRYLNIKLNDRINTLLLFAQPIIIAVLVTLIFKDMHLGILFLMAISAIWFGVSNAAKEIVGEMPIYKRERMFNLRILTYISSKITVLTLFAALQVLVFVAIIYLRFRNDTPQGLEESLQLGYYWRNVSFMLYLSFSATIMGLFLSAVFDNAEKVMSFVPIALMPQIMLAGVVTKLDDKVIEGISYFTLGRWGTEGFATMQDQYNTVQDTCSGSVIATFPVMETTQNTDSITHVTTIITAPVDSLKLGKESALKMLDFYNNDLMGVASDGATIVARSNHEHIGMAPMSNIILAITILNVLVFMGLFIALKKKDSIK